MIRKFTLLLLLPLFLASCGKKEETPSQIINEALTLAYSKKWDEYTRYMHDHLRDNEQIPYEEFKNAFHANGKDDLDKLIFKNDGFKEVIIMDEMIEQKDNHQVARIKVQIEFNNGYKSEVWTEYLHSLDGKVWTYN